MEVWFCVGRDCGTVYTGRGTSPDTAYGDWCEQAGEEKKLPDSNVHEFFLGKSMEVTAHLVWQIQEVPENA